MSPQPFVKNLTFQSNDLVKEVTIMLTWSPNVDGLYEDVFPIVWKVSKFVHFQYLGHSSGQSQAKASRHWRLWPGLEFSQA
ncbi:hypothetical protein EV424DRAFT_1545186 [Suillus variegatus]|nr:hypothetical protein EV424DRAFT_1545186 [Suillus variegatus]